MANSDLGPSGQISAINVTPLVDVVLVLLVVLMVTASAIVSETIPLDLPEASTGEGVATTLAVSIDHDGSLYLNLQEVTEASLRRHIQEAQVENEEVRAVLAADRRIEHGRVVQVIDLLRAEGVTRFAIHVRSPQ